jgi:dTDP-4-amino-4,6-dideoxygalactose transaminase
VSAVDPIPFIDLDAQRRRLGAAVDRAVLAVLDHGRFVLGPEVDRLEALLAERSGVRRAVTVGSGTDALLLTLRAWGVGPGDAVLVPAFTFVATAEVVALLGATPIFCDVLADGALLDPAEIGAGVDAARAAGLRPRAVVPVGLYGQPVDEAAVADAAAAHGLLVLGDAAQSYGATVDGVDTGRFGDATATSFFPSKPLGCYGDGGAVLTDDLELADLLVSLRMHGFGDDRYEHVRVGTTSRLDTVQAAVLLEKLTIFDDELARREAVAARYGALLRDAVGEHVVVPEVAVGRTSAWAQYTIRVPERTAVRAALDAAGVPTAVHYPTPLHQQPAYLAYPRTRASLSVAEALAADVLSLPMHPYLDDTTQDRVVEAVADAVRGAVPAAVTS